MGQQQVMTVLMDDGTPRGTLKIDLATWDCAMYRIARNDLQNYTNDQALKNCGIYFLVGVQNGIPAVYVGQANSRNNGKGVLGRVIEHDKSTEAYWNEALLIYSRSNSLYATELNYLERSLWDKIQKGSYKVINASKPAPGNCSSITQVTMDRFIEGVEYMAEIFRYDFLQPAQPNAVVPSPGKQFFIKRTSTTPGRSVDAICEIQGSKFVVLKDSLVATVPRDSSSARMYSHDKYGSMIDTAGRLTQNISFDKVSGSSAFALYGSSNGNADWKDSNGDPIKNYI